MRYIITVIVILSAFSIGFSQDSPQQKYLNAKQLMAEGRYGLARDLFKQLTENDSNHSFGEYASYYYGICAYNQGFVTLSRDMFFQITRKYADWNQMNEVYFWLGKILLEQGDYFRGLEYASKISDAKMASEIFAMEKHYLIKIHSADSVNDLYRMFEKNEAVAQRLFELELLLPHSSRDYNLMKELGNSFPSIGDRMTAVRPDNEFKDTYQISLLLPLMMNQLNPDLQPKFNEFVLDLYRGIKSAVDSLNRDDNRISLHVYDTKRDSTVLKQILDKKELKESDLIIGPLYNSSIAGEFAKENKINIVNPLTKNTSIIENNPNFFLYTQTSKDVGYASANFILSDSTLKKGVIFYGEGSRDKEIVSAFMDSVKHNKNLEISSYLIPKDGQRKILDVLTRTRVINEIEEDDKPVILPEFDFAFVSATEKDGTSIYSNALTAVEVRGDSLLLLGSHNWLDDRIVDPVKFQTQKVYMASPDFINYTSKTYVKYEKAFMKYYGVAPSKYALTGFDMMSFYGNALIENGKYFQYSILESHRIYPAKLSGGFNYFNSNTNRFVPVVFWNGSKMKLAK